MKKVLIVTMITLTSLTIFSCSKDETFSTGTLIKTSSTSVQCSGTTQSGVRCKNMTKSSNGRCYLHGGN